MTHAEEITHVREGAATPRPPWKHVVRTALDALGGEASLQALYAQVKASARPGWLTTHWKAKVRQVVQRDPLIESVSFGTYRRRRAAPPRETTAFEPERC